jgi:hypothetical protein
MKEGRASFLDLLGRIDAHLRRTGQEERLAELDVYWRAFDQPDNATAARAFEKLIVQAQGHGFDVELLPFALAARVWCHKLGLGSLHDE